ncbi:MAG: hypothetical protein ACLP22_11435 [Solirubrobacteraceae bacterium]
MSVRQTLPVLEVPRGRRIGWVDVVVGAQIIAVFYEVVHLGHTRATLDTTGPTFVVFLLGVIVIVGGLIYGRCSFWARSVSASSADPHATGWSPTTTTRPW